MQDNRQSSETGKEIKAKPFRHQKFNELRDSCLKRGILFEDPYFDRSGKDLFWKRPFEIVPNPKFFVDNASRHDVVQGILGDCYLMGAITAIAERPELLQKVFPQDQSFYHNYAGIFHFRLWHFGKWFDVVIDDRLPTDYDGNLLFSHSPEKNEFWVPLLEKCYSKIFNVPYEGIEGGRGQDALVDLTGGLQEPFNLRYAPSDLDSILLNSYFKGSLMLCSLENENAQMGLKGNHTYTITALVHTYLNPYGDLTLLRIRNPWGRAEWKGRWCEGSDEWRSLPSDIKRRYDVVQRDDGEFWMSYSDFRIYFDWVILIHLTPDPFEHSLNLKKIKWHSALLKGSWVKGLSDGGFTKMHLNPHVKFSVIDVGDSNKDGLCSIIVSLMQKTKFSQRGNYDSIGLAVYKMDDPKQVLDEYFIVTHKRVKIIYPIRRREVAGRFNLLPGYYTLIPFKFFEGLEGNYILRFFSETKYHIDDLDDKIGLRPIKTRLSVVELKNEEAEETKESILRDFFYEITGKDMEANWYELKHILDYSAKTDNTYTNNEESHFIFDILTYVINLIIGPSSNCSAFGSMGAEGFPKDLCRSMISLHDIDNTGKLSFSEFQDLWLVILKWKSIYEIHSKKSGGILTPAYLKQVLAAEGFKLSNTIINDLVHRYGNKERNIFFDDFLLCIFKLTSISNYIQIKYNESKEVADFTLEQLFSNSLN